MWSTAAASSVIITCKGSIAPRLGLFLLIMGLFGAIFTGYFSLRGSTWSLFGAEQQIKTVDELQIQFQLDTKQGAPASSITDFRFYLHSLKLRTLDGLEIQVQLNRAEKSNNVAMVDLGNLNTFTLTGHVSSVSSHAQVSSLSFEVGVPFALNHANPLLAEPPLDESAMFWVWQQGYKFIKLDVESPDSLNMSLHLGSAGCESASALRAPEISCRYPNRVLVELEISDIKNIRLIVNPWLLIRAMRNNNVNICTGAANFTTTCATALERLGLNSTLGVCINNCRAQGLFSVNVDA